MNFSRRAFGPNICFFGGGLLFHTAALPPTGGDHLYEVVPKPGPARAVGTAGAGRTALPCGTLHECCLIPDHYPLRGWFCPPQKKQSVGHFVLCSGFSSAAWMIRSLFRWFSVGTAFCVFKFRQNFGIFPPIFVPFSQRFFLESCWIWETWVADTFFSVPRVFVDFLSFFNFWPRTARFFGSAVFPK